MSTTFSNAVVLVTGANGGLGQEFVRQALERGATKVYATARTPREWGDSRVVLLALDVTDAASIDAAVALAGDTSIVINNAGITTANDSLLSGDPAEIRRVFETNFFGAVAVVRAFAGVVKANGGGAFVDVHSALSWWAGTGAYSASKAAFWSASNSMRVELATAGTHLLGLHMGYVDTPMTAGIDAPMSTVEQIVTAALDGLEAGEYEVLADDVAVGAKQGVSAPIEAAYPSLARA